ncbi:MAG: ABC transporter permease [Methanobacteriota archaeon]|nr:MAG: ABC transporter permease [Euryarchaeota archaeon]
MATVTARLTPIEQGWSAFRSVLAGVYRILRRDRLGLIGLGIILAFVVVAVLAPWIAPFPSQGRGLSNLSETLQPPSGAHLLGTDEFGRDLLSRIMFGAGLALQVGMLTVALAFPFGVLLGVVAGILRGIPEEVVMRVTDMFLAFPPILLAFVIAATLGRGTNAIILAMAVSFWPWYTRLVHSQVLHVRSQAFVEAATVLGLPRRRIIFRHVLPNTLTSASIQGSMDIGSAILIGAALSWIGLGPQPPTPDWGVMFNTAYLTGSFVTFWWYSTFTGLALFLVVLAFNLLGDSLRDALDPKLRRRRLIL